MQYKKQQFNEILSRIKEPRSKIQVIVGPRQVGKTTIINQVLEECNIPYASHSADDISNAKSDWLSEIWESQRLKMDVYQQSQRLLVIDEIQKINNWSETVKLQ